MQSGKAKKLQKPLSSFQTIHKPVLVQEVVSFLARPDAVLVDGTIGGGGHAEALLSASGRDATLLGIDLDKNSIKHASARLVSFGSRVTIVHDTFAHVDRIVREERSVNGILFDLGMSSMHLEVKRGFSFQKQGELDMRFDTSEAVELPTPSHPALQRLAGRLRSYRAQDILAYLSADEIEEILESLGGERYARRIAQAIVSQRKTDLIRTTEELVDCVVRALPPSARRGRIHAATRTFQALRMAVNRELESLENGIAGALQVLAPGGRLAVLSFHGGEDRIVKWMFRNAAKKKEFSILTKKPIVPSSKEKRDNPRSRSAKLRVLEISHM